MAYTIIGRNGRETIFVEERGAGNDRLDAGERIGIRDEGNLSSDRFVRLERADGMLRALGIQRLPRGARLTSVAQYVSGLRQAREAMAHDDFRSACLNASAAEVEARLAGIEPDRQAIWGILTASGARLRERIAFVEEKRLGLADNPDWTLERSELSLELARLRFDLSLCNEIMGRLGTERRR